MCYQLVNEVDYIGNYFCYIYIFIIVFKELCVNHYWNVINPKLCKLIVILKMKRIAENRKSVKMDGLKPCQKH